MEKVHSVGNVETSGSKVSVRVLSPRSTTSHPRRTALAPSRSHCPLLDSVTSPSRAHYKESLLSVKAYRGGSLALSSGLPHPKGKTRDLDVNSGSVPGEKGLLVRKEATWTGTMSFRRETTLVKKFYFVP